MHSIMDHFLTLQEKTNHMREVCTDRKNMILQFAGATQRGWAHLPNAWKKYTLQFFNFRTLEKETRSINEVYHLSYKYYPGINTDFHLSFSQRPLPPHRFLLINFLPVLLQATKCWLPRLISPRSLQVPAVWCPVVLPSDRYFSFVILRIKSKARKLTKQKKKKKGQET